MMVPSKARAPKPIALLRGCFLGAGHDWNQVILHLEATYVSNWVQIQRYEYQLFSQDTETFQRIIRIKWYMLKYISTTSARW